MNARNNREVTFQEIDIKRVDINNLGSECSCPYCINCKHGVAVLLQYMGGDFSDADEVTKSLDTMSSEELRGVIDSLICANPSNLNVSGY